MQFLHTSIQSVEFGLKVELEGETRSPLFLHPVVEDRLSQLRRLFQFVERNQTLNEVRSVLNEVFIRSVRPSDRPFGLNSVRVLQAFPRSEPVGAVHVVAFGIEVNAKGTLAD